MEILRRIFEMTAIDGILRDPLSLVMLLLGFIILYLGIYKKYEPLLLVPIGFGVLLANIPGGEMGVVSSEMNEGLKHMTLNEIAENHGIMNMLYYALP